MDPAMAKRMDRLIKGAMITVTELGETKRDLGRTQYAAKVQQQRRVMKKTPLQSGGVLKVAEGRQMVRKKEVNELERARKMVEAAEQKRRRAAKQCFANAAKTARQWRLNVKLRTAYVWETDRGWRLLRRI